MFVDEVLQRLGELGGIAQGAVDEGVAHHLAANAFAGLFRVSHVVFLSVGGARRATS
jgi:hypothetical protein